MARWYSQIVYKHWGRYRLTFMHWMLITLRFRRTNYMDRKASAFCTSNRVVHLHHYCMADTRKVACGLVLKACIILLALALPARKQKNSSDMPDRPGL